MRYRLNYTGLHHDGSKKKHERYMHVFLMKDDDCVWYLKRRRGKGKKATHLHSLITNTSASSSNTNWS